MEGKFKWGALGVIGGGAAAQIVPVITILTDKTPTEIAEKWNVWWPIISYGLPFVFAILAVVAVGFLTSGAYRRGKRDGIALSRNPSAALEAAIFGSTAELESPVTERIPKVLSMSERGYAVGGNVVSAADRTTNHYYGMVPPFEMPMPLAEQEAAALCKGLEISAIENPWRGRNGSDLSDLQYAINQVIDALTETGTCRDDVVRDNIGILEADHPAWRVDAAYAMRSKFLKASRDALSAREVKGNSVHVVIGDYPDNIRERHIQKVKTQGNMLRDQLRKLPRTVIL